MSTRKIEKEEAEQMEKEYVNAWAAEKRKKQAEKEFKKWVNKKNLVMLEKTTEELKEAKQEREEVEKKLKVRRALLHAKILSKCHNTNHLDIYLLEFIFLFILSLYLSS